MLQFGASLIDDARLVIYGRNMFMTKATGRGSITLNITVILDEN